ncbi:hypothetical protein D046_8470A, partial [Vibrio parahaemolyticus V-223/04]
MFSLFAFTNIDEGGKKIQLSVPRKGR